MMSRRVRLGVLLPTLVVVVGTMAPAQASWHKFVVFTGTVTLTGCAGLGNPNGAPTIQNTTKAGPKGEPEVNTTVNGGNTCNFTMATTTCTKDSYGKKAGTLQPCLITAMGTLSGFCATTSGTGTATLKNLSQGAKDEVVTQLKISSFALGMRFSGGNATQNVSGTAAITPATGDCANKTATGFTIAGDAKIKRVT